MKNLEDVEISEAQSEGVRYNMQDDCNNTTNITRPTLRNLV